MALKDEIFLSFMNHEIISDKYNLSEVDIPRNLNEGKKSEVAIVKAIALIVEKVEVESISDKALYTLITQYLNEAAI